MKIEKKWNWKIYGGNDTNMDATTKSKNRNKIAVHGDKGE